MLLLLTLREHRLGNKERSVVDLAQVALLSKMAALLAAQDPMTFQAIQAMEYSPSVVEEEITEEEESIDSLLERHTRGDDLDEEDYERIERSTIGDFRDPLDPR